MRLINFSSHRLFNYEETGLSGFQHKACKVISLKGKRRISVFSRESSLVTIFICMNATVMYVPSLLMFPRSYMKAELLNSPPPGSIAAGWIQRKRVYAKFQHFVCFMKLSKIDPVFLTLDGHYSHSRNIEVIECDRKNGVHVVCFSPHSIHKLQFLGVIGKTGCTLFAFPRIVFINCNFWE